MHKQRPESNDLTGSWATTTFTTQWCRIKLSHAIQSDQWTDEEVTPYLRIQDELAVYRGIVLRHTRIVLPFSLRERAVELAHRGHQGVVKTKSLLREKAWFPGIDAMVEERVKACIPCQATSTHGSEHCTPLKMSHLPDRPWKELSIDFIGPFPTGESLNSGCHGRLHSISRGRDRSLY